MNVIARLEFELNTIPQSIVLSTRIPPMNVLLVASFDYIWSDMTILIAFELLLDFKVQVNTKRLSSMKVFGQKFTFRSLSQKQDDYPSGTVRAFYIPIQEKNLI